METLRAVSELQRDARAGPSLRGNYTVACRKCVATWLSRQVDGKVLMLLCKRSVCMIV